MSTQAWHCDAPMLRRYADGAVDLALAASIEAHLIRCADCRAALAGQTDPVELAPGWAGGCLHTLNRSRDFEFIDGSGRAPRLPFLSR